MPEFRIDVEEMPEKVQANNIADALRIAISEIGVHPVDKEKCAGCGQLTDNTCSECYRSLCDSVGEGCVCPCQQTGPDNIFAACSICGNESSFDKDSLVASTHLINGVKHIICCPCEDDLVKKLADK